MVDSTLSTPHHECHTRPTSQRPRQSKATPPTAAIHHQQPNTQPKPTPRQNPVATPAKGPVIETRNLDQKSQTTQGEPEYRPRPQGRTPTHSPDPNQAAYPAPNPKCQMEKGATDPHYSILSLLLFLSDSPSNTNFTERPRVKEAELEDHFDWAKYLMEGEDIDTGPYPDTPDWSDNESEDDDSQQPISREDSGIQLDRTPQEDQDNASKTVPVAWTVGEPDARAWLEQHVVTPYWTTNALRFPHSLHLHSNLLNVWDQHLYNTEPLYLLEEKTFVTETQVIRETLWLFSGVKKHFIFQQHDGKVSVRNDVVVTHLTSNCLYSLLEHIAVYGQAVSRLQRFIDEVTGVELLKDGDLHLNNSRP
ncbi:gamma-tubulin complex component 5 [Nematolebias whitei]|uniref:gamma-tubulin complex component 5 n=1 Tax=Nematolebias whitei TaxID=451745 RepID=UPI00189A440E|nr:gamma-tubulin complex component 5 [Nematolebias whitei]